MLSPSPRDAANLEKKLLAIQDAPTVRAGLRALGMTSIFDWYTERERILAQRSPLVHPLYRPYLFLPGVRARMFHDGSEFAWAERIEARCADIRRELETVLAGDRGFQPYRTVEDEEMIMPGKRREIAIQPTETPGWNMLYFYYLGVKVEDNCALCPRTTEILESIPRFVRCTISCFSALNPGTDLAPHFGPTNAVLRVHLGLKAPPNCHLRVADEVRGWKEGKLLFFSDAFEHQVWHGGAETRIVLFFDVYHPDWTEEELPLVEEFLRSDGEEGSVDFWTRMQQLRRGDADMLTARRWWT